MQGRERVLRHLDGNETDRLALMPITMMFAAEQAGVAYGTYVRDHRVLAEAQLLTAERFDFDHVSVISDPTREAADCGAAIQFFDDQPPAVIEEQALLLDRARLARLSIPDPYAGGRMADRLEAVALLRKKSVGAFLVEGWVEGPCAEAADLRGINNLMLDFYDDPEWVTELFEFTTEMALRFARAQVQAGVDIIGVGDAAASLVGPRIYEEFVWPFEKRLVDGLHEMGTLVRLHICGDTRQILTGMGRLGCDVVDLDYPVPIARARGVFGPDQVILGNIDPVSVLKNGSAGDVAREIAACHAAVGSRYIVGAGCEVPRGTPPENVNALRDYARAHRP